MGTAKRERQKANRQARLQAMQVQAKRQKTKKTGLKVGGAIVALVAVALILAFTVGKDDDNEVVAPADTTLPVEPTTPAAVESTAPADSAPCPAADGSSAPMPSFPAPQQMCIDPTKTYTAEVDTNKGTFTMALDATKAPNTVNNFVVLSRYHFYDGVICHRIISDFAIQCGDPTGTGSGGPGYAFGDELPASMDDYKVGTLAMANSGPNTNGSQFFIVMGEGNLTPDYSIFGAVTEGLDTTVNAMEAAANPDPASNGVPPIEEIKINSVTITES